MMDDLDDTDTDCNLSPEEKALLMVREQILAETPEVQYEIQAAYQAIGDIARGSEGGLMALALLCAEIDCGVSDL